MAPEINSQPHDEKSDLYSVGGVLLNMLTTQMYSEEEFHKKLGKMKEDPEILNEILEEVSEVGLLVCLVGFLTSSSTTRLYRGRAPRQSV